VTTVQIPQRSIDLVEPEVQASLLEVRKLYPDAFLAGGYLRDRKVGVRPVDVDFFSFLPIRSDRTQYVSHWDSADFGLVEKRLTGVESFGAVDFDVPVDLLGVEMPRAIPVQIIHIDPVYSTTPAGVVSKFLFGAQQSFWMPDQLYGKTEAYMYDMHNRCFTVTRCEHELDVSSTWLKWEGTSAREGLSSRYRGWKLRVPVLWWPRFEVKFEGDWPVVDGHVVIS
jgi:hypothetical protein